MRHCKHKQSKLGRDSGHRRCLMANLLKALIVNGRITTTVAKAKALRRYADRMVTLAKRNTLSTRRKAIGDLMVRFNPLTSQKARRVKAGNDVYHNDDRRVISILFDELGKRFENREGGYTRIVRCDARRVGDNAETCIIEYLSE